MAQSSSGILGITLGPHVMLLLCAPLKRTANLCKGVEGVRSLSLLSPSFFEVVICGRMVGCAFAGTGER